MPLKKVKDRHKIQHMSAGVSNSIVRKRDYFNNSFQGSQDESYHQIAKKMEETSLHG